MRWFLERIVSEGWPTKLFIEVCPLQHRRVVHIISIVGVCPIDIHRRVTHIISIVGVCPINIHRRVVHKIDYRSLSTIYIGGLSTVKINTFVWKWFSFMTECMFKGVSEKSRRMGVRDMRYHSSLWV